VPGPEVVGGVLELRSDVRVGVDDDRPPVEGIGPQAQRLLSVALEEEEEREERDG
jgi:hypothetical protein